MYLLMLYKLSYNCSEWSFKPLLVWKSPCLWTVCFSLNKILISSKALWIFFWHILSRVLNASLHSFSHQLSPWRYNKKGKKILQYSWPCRQLSKLQAVKTWIFGFPWIRQPPANERIVKNRGQETESTDNGQTKHKNRTLTHKIGRATCRERV